MTLGLIVSARKTVTHFSFESTFAYIEIKEESYSIPYGSRPDLTGLDNGILYSSTEIGNILNETFSDVYHSEENSGNVANVQQRITAK